MFRILSFKRPSNLIDTNSVDRINKIYENENLSKTSKKQIVNILLGLMEKKFKKKSDCKLFMTKEEAQYYVDTYGGKVGELSYYYDIPDDESEGYLFATGNREERVIYTVVQTKERELVNGFLPIKEMIYDIQRYKLYNMFKKCKANDIEVHGIKTDCVLVKRSDMYRLWQVFEKDIDDNSIGKYKLEFEKSLFGEKLVLAENQKDSEKLRKIEIQEIELKNEYDKEEVAQVNLENNRLIYLASDAGCGKSTACCQGFEKSSVLFVSPFNKQCIELQKEGFKAITVHTFFGRGLIAIITLHPMIGQVLN